MKFKPKFDKKRCHDCIFKCETLNTGSGIGANIKIHDKYYYIYCNYASITGETCLKRGPKGEAIDIRGEGPKCKLFKKGDGNVTKRRMGDICLSEP